MRTGTSFRNLINTIKIDNIGSFLISCSLFFGGTGLGFLINSLHPKPVYHAEQATYSLTMLDIARGNVEVLITLSIGGFLLGIPTIISLISNGVVMGVIVASIVRNYGFPVVLFTILPRGILEIAGICLAGMVGFRETRTLLDLFLGRSNRFTNRREIWGWIGWLLISIGLILIAATIESTVTPWLANRFL